MIELTDRIKNAEQHAHDHPDPRAVLVAGVLTQAWRNGTPVDRSVIPPELEGFADEVSALLRGERILSRGQQVMDLRDQKLARVVIPREPIGSQVQIKQEPEGFAVWRHRTELMTKTEAAVVLNRLQRAADAEAPGPADCHNCGGEGTRQPGELLGDEGVPCPACGGTGRETER